MKLSICFRPAPLLICLALAGCATGFVSPPPAAYRSSPAPHIAGLWGKLQHQGRDDGERLRTRLDQAGELRIQLFNANPQAESASTQPFRALAYRFGEQDWLLLDVKEIAAANNEKPDAREDSLVLINYRLEGERLCGREISGSLIADAVAAGKLAGRSSGQFLRHTAVRASGADWLAWWLALPTADRQFGDEYCLKRLGE